MKPRERRVTTRMWRISLAVTALVALGIQVIPVDRSNPPVSNEIWVPLELRETLRTSCYDCHSNETVWPWYSYVAPLSWGMARDVRRGRAKLNFSEWPFLASADETFLLEVIDAQLRHRTMPLRAYTLAHPSARLSEEDYDQLLDWFAPSRGFEGVFSDGLGR